MVQTGSSPARAADTEGADPVPYPGLTSAPAVPSATRPVRALVIVGGAYLAAFAGWQIFLADDGRVDLVVGQVAFVPVCVAMVAAAWGAAHRRGVEASVARGWRWLAVAWLMLAAGSLSEAMYQGLSGSIPFPSFADVFYLGYYIPAVIGFTRFPRKPTTRSERVRMALDLSVVFLSCASVIWYLVLGPTVTAGGQSLSLRALAGAYPLGDALHVFTLVYVIQRVRTTSMKRPLTFLLAGVVVVVTCNTALGWFIIHPHYYSEALKFLQPASMAGLLLFVLAATRQATTVEAERTRRAASTAIPSGGGQWLTFAAPATLFGLLLAAQFGASLGARVGLTITAVVVAALMLLRQALAQRDTLVAQGDLRHQALHDALTGLPNRALITDRIGQLLARNHRNGTTGAALFVDLDGFKDINDTLGHAAGDELLRAVAERLATGLRDADTIGRMGGDEFIVLIDGAANQSAPDLVAQRLLDLMRQPFILEASAIPIVVTTSIGVATGDRDTAGDLLRDADIAMYMAKAAGKNCYEVFRPGMDSDVTRRHRLDFDLRSALDSNQFSLVYQPIYNLDDLALVGVEALIRWEHPALGQIQPDEFIPLLESSGQILEVGRWVLQQACAQMAGWRDRGSDLTISVNISGRQLDRDIIIDDVRDALTGSGLDPTSLTLEVTETALMRNVETTATRLRELKELGIQIAIDDFGTGYSSLAYLQRLPVDCLKIDRSFTNTITRSPEADAIIRTLVQLGKDLGLKTLAEGVESTDQVDHLRSEDVNQVQGFLMSRPLDPTTLETQLLQPIRPANFTRLLD